MQPEAPVTPPPQISSPKVVNIHGLISHFGKQGLRFPKAWWQAHANEGKMPVSWIADKAYFSIDAVGEWLLAKMQQQQKRPKKKPPTSPVNESAEDGFVPKSVSGAERGRPAKVPGTRTVEDFMDAQTSRDPDAPRNGTVKNSPVQHHSI